jgi:predicted alpha/beta hydrolase family esterase
LTWLVGAGHINAASGHRQWEEGLAELDALLHAVRAGQGGGAQRQQA